MKVGINNLPLKNGHKQRGIGYYTDNLITFLKKHIDIEVVQFTNLSDVKDVDLIHYPWFDFYFHTLPIKKRFKTVVTIHDTIPLIFPSRYPVGIKGKINFFMQKLSLKKTNAIITDSDVSKKDIIKFLKVEENKVNSIPLAADSDFKVLNDTKLIHIKRRFNLPDNFLLYVGDANWVKNLPFLIESFYQISKIFKDLKLVLVGGVFLKNVEDINHPELESLKQVNRLIKELNLGENVLRVGNLPKEDLIAFYNLATVYIQPSLYEGFGLPVLQAFACGVPVVSSNKGSLPEIGGDAAIYFDPTKKEQLIKIVEEVLQNKSLQRKLSELGLKQNTKFSWERVAEETKAVYTKVIKGE